MPAAQPESPILLNLGGKHFLNDIPIEQQRHLGAPIDLNHIEVILTGPAEGDFKILLRTLADNGLIATVCHYHPEPGVVVYPDLGTRRIPFFGSSTTESETEPGTHEVLEDAGTTFSLPSDVPDDDGEPSNNLTKIDPRRITSVYLRPEGAPVFPGLDERYTPGSFDKDLVAGTDRSLIYLIQNNIGFDKLKEELGKVLAHFPSEMSVPLGVAGFNIELVGHKMEVEYDKINRQPDQGIPTKFEDVSKVEEYSYVTGYSILQNRIMPVQTGIILNS